MRYLLCTSTATLAAALERLHIPFTPLGRAERERLDPAERARWGEYYEATPQVGIIPLANIGTLFAHATGRYSFAAAEVTLLASDPPLTTPVEIQASNVAG
jgi:hypothetical protein